MRLFKLTSATIFRRKTWAVAAFGVIVLPFILPHLSSATENPSLYQPALAQATWSIAWIAAIFWGFFAAAQMGEKLSRSGLGEYFQSLGVGATRQLAESWAALALFVLPLGFASAILCIAAASPSLPEERTLWIATNFQYAILFFLVVAPLLAVAIAVATRFGSITGFLASSGICAYGLYGVGYLKLLTQVEGNPVLTWLWKVSPHYHFADPTERLRYKLGAIEWSQFPLLLTYFTGIALLYFALSRALFRTRTLA